MNLPINSFFLGKGGVGKSTSSVNYSVFLANQGNQVVLVSMDPAHNLSDIFEKKLSDKPTQISPGLVVIEVDQEKWVKKYLKGISRQIKRSYSYLTAFNLDHYFEVIRFSPGLEEYALILAFQDIQQNFHSVDFIVFDMPPTALSLKFFTLPSLSLVWTEKLLDLRRQIIEKRELITKIKLLKKEYETDKILKKILEQKAYFTSLNDGFQNRNMTKIYLVLNPDSLSFSESKRIFEKLKEIHISIDQIVFNKSQQTSSYSNVENFFPGIPLVQIPLSDRPLTGYHTIDEFLKSNQVTFQIPANRTDQ